MNFDMKRIGKNIATLRRDHNMTQMQLADEVGVSFQAVSNWERGNSMPDISKLPQLSELFSVSIDELLGCSAPLVEKAAEGNLEEHLKALEERGIYITVQEAAEAGPILLPEQMDIVIDQVMRRSDLDEFDEDDDDEDEDDHDDDDKESKPRKEPFGMQDLLPFMSTEKVDQLIRQKAENGSDLFDYLPFASEKTVDEIARQLEECGEKITTLAPFMSQKAVNEIATERMNAGQSFTILAPFMSSEAVDNIALQMEARNESINSLAPFISAKTLETIVLSRLKAGRKVTSLLPFVGESLLNRLADTLHE